MATKNVEYRGVSDMRYSEVLSDTLEGITFGEWKEFAGIAKILKTTESSNETHYYDNVPATVISSTSSDEITINSSVIPSDVYAEITGQYYDKETGMLVEGERDPSKQWAIGYKADKSDGTSVFVVRFKGSFSLSDQEHNTIDDSNDANGQEIVFTGISTNYTFKKTGKKATGIQIDTSVNKDMTIEKFYKKVITPDNISENE